MIKTTTNTTYNDHKLCSSKDYSQGHYTDVLNAIDTRLNYMTESHKRVFFAMLVVKYPEAIGISHQENNALISKLTETIKIYCKRHNHAPQFLWVRECSSTGQIHYHVMMLFDANFVNNAHGIKNKATELWQRYMGIQDGRGLVHLCPFSGINERYGGVEIRRDDPNFHQVYEQCFQWASYLAKVYSKGNAPANVNEFGGSRVP